MLDASPHVTFSLPSAAPVTQVQATPRAAATPKAQAPVQSTTKPVDWRGTFKKFIWDQENANQTGLRDGQWHTYDDRGHPAVGPGLRVPKPGTYSREQIDTMLEKSISDHYARAAQAFERRHGQGSFSKLPESKQWGLTDFYYNGVDAPRLSAAMHAGDWKGMRNEHVRYTTQGTRKVPLTRRNEAWWNTFIAPLEKASAKRLGAGVLIKNKDGSYLLERNHPEKGLDAEMVGKTRPIGGGWQARDRNLRETAARELEEELGLDYRQTYQNLKLLGYIKAGPYRDCAMFELPNPGIRPGKFQASNSKNEWVQLVRSKPDGENYIGCPVSKLREAETKHEEECKSPMFPKEASVIAADAEPTSGPFALRALLQDLDLEQIERDARADIATGKITKRRPAVKKLQVLEGLRRNKLNAGDLMVQSVPVIPPAFRPFAVAGETLIPGDANELYRDLVNYRDIYTKVRTNLGEEGAKDARMNLWKAHKALYGYDEPVSDKVRSRGVSGFLNKILGSGPKHSFLNRKLLAKPQDTVGRSVIIIDPELGMDEIGIPESIAWKFYAPYLQRRLVRRGISPRESLQHLSEQSEVARRALDEEMQARPVIYSRAPAWHKFSALAGKPKLIEGDAIAVNSLVTGGLGADFDGDAINLHLPTLDDEIKEAHERLMPSKMLLQIRDDEAAMPVPKHEVVQGLFAAQRRPAKRSWDFASETEALRAAEAGEIGLADEVRIGGK